MTHGARQGSPVGWTRSPRSLPPRPAAPVLGVARGHPASRPGPAAPRAGWPRRRAMLTCPQAPAGRGPRAPADAQRHPREGTMPRSFLVKTHSSHRVPNYGQLETQKVGAARSCHPAQGSTPAGQEGKRLRPPRPREPGHLSQVGGGTTGRGGRKGVQRAPYALQGPRPRVRQSG